MTAAETRAALSADRVDLVDEDDAGGVAACGLKQVAHARCAHADVHLHKVRAGDRVERNVCLAGNRLGKQGLTRTGRAHQQHAVRDLGAQLFKFCRVLEKFDDLFKLFLFLVRACHVGKGDALFLIACHLDARAPEAVHLAALPVHLPDHIDPEGDEDDHHDEIG